MGIWLLGKVSKKHAPEQKRILTDLSVDTFRENVTRLIDQIVGPFNKAETPFAVTHGVSLLPPLSALYLSSSRHRITTTKPM